MAVNTFSVPELYKIEAFGKLIIERSNREDHVHLLIYEAPGPNGEKGLEAACLDWGLFSWGLSLDDALFDISTMCLEFLLESSAEHIAEESASHDMDEFRSIYRKMVAIFGEPKEREVELIPPEHSGLTLKPQARFRTIRANERQQLSS